MSAIESLLAKQYSNPAGELSPQSATSLPTVTDPNATLAQISRSQWDSYQNNFKGFESQLVAKGYNDTSLIDQAKVDAPMASKLAGDMAKRNADRYGLAFDPATLKEQRRAGTRSESLVYNDSVNNARYAQDSQNKGLLAGLVNIGQGVSNAAIDGMTGAAGMATSRKNAYDSAKAQSKANTIGTLGSLAGMAIMAV